MTLEIPAGSAVALVGLNGAGKSTLVKLLCRFYDPVEGSISWDGIDLRSTNVQELRMHMSVVFQDYMPYDFSAATNIGIGDIVDMNDRARVMHAARAAGVHESIERLPRGYDTLLSRTFYQDEIEDPTKGVTLSGGQWQRIAVARALMRRDRDFLILDEPSAGLDPIAEERVHDELRKYRVGATSLLISHRLGTTRGADKIAVLDNGSIVEEGSHDDLMALDGLYSRMFRKQAARFASEVHIVSEVLERHSER